MSVPTPKVAQEVVPEREAAVAAARAERAGGDPETPEERRREVDLTKGEAQCEAKVAIQDGHRRCKLVDGHAGSHESYAGVVWPT